jgi:hypothetical protein
MEDVQCKSSQAIKSFFPVPWPSGSLQNVKVGLYFKILFVSTIWILLFFWRSKLNIIIILIILNLFYKIGFDHYHYFLIDRIGIW